MTGFGEIRSGSEALTEEEVLAFRDEILVPSIDFLARSNFVNEASPRNTFVHEQTVASEESIRRYRVSAFIDTLYDPVQVENEPNRVCSISVGIETPTPNLTDALTERWLEKYPKLKIDEQQQALLSAWTVDIYYFDIPQENGTSPLVRTHIELQDSEGSTLWDDDDDDEAQQETEGSELDDETSEAADILFGQLEQEAMVQLTKTDLAAIQDTLIALGVNFDIVYPGVWAQPS